MMIRLLATVAAVAMTIACTSSSTPAAPSAPEAAAPVTATISPVPVPATLESSAGSAVMRYRVTGSVTFHAQPGVSGRITQMTLALLNDEGAGSPQTVSLALELPSGGIVGHQFLQAIEFPGQATRLQASASGVDGAGKPFAVAPVQAPLAVSAPATGGSINHVFLVVEENHSFEDVIGNPEMPYLNSLATQYALATEYYGVTHPSIGNYFMLTVGRIVTNSDSYSSVVSEDNIVRQLIAAGRTWKSYAEDLPSVGYTGGDVGLYARRHNVIALLADVALSTTQSANLVPFNRFAADLAANTLPSYSHIVPNLCNNGHDCPPSTVDRWLQANIGPLIGSGQFQRDGLLIITFDEGSDADTRHGGGRVAWVAVGPWARRGYRSSTLYQHDSTLRLIGRALGLTAFPNQASSAPDMTEFLLF